MARISIFVQTKKTSGKIKIRFRLKDGRDVQLYHKSEIEADLSDLSKFEADGTPKKRANYNRNLYQKISERVALIESIYNDGVSEGRDFTKESFEEEINKQLYPEQYQEEEEDTSAKILLTRFAKYIDDGLFSKARKAGYWVTWRILERFLIIHDKTSILFDEVTPDFLIAFHKFIINEYEFAKKKKWAKLYEDISKNNFPDAPRAQNTTAIKLKMLQAFFAQLEDADEITKSPFRKMGRENRKTSLREHYVAPVALTLEEVRRILETDVKPSLQSTKDAFLLQCALGCRISDFKAMGIKNVAISSDGIPFVRYVAQKTQHSMTRITETKTPLIRFAFDIVKRTNFNLPILKYVSGMNGFNKKIKILLSECGINREVEVFNESENKVEHKPLYEVASTKLGRKTNVTLLSRVQINSTVAGLHAEGSEAVAHYYDQSLQDLFLLMSRAFGEQPYKTDKKLNIIN